MIGSFLAKQDDERCLQFLFSLHGKRLFVSALRVAQIVSFFQKKKTNDIICKFVQTIITKFTVIGFSDKDIEMSLLLETQDMEDNIQYVISQKFKCFYFVTNNKSDYTGFSNLNVLTAKRYEKLTCNFAQRFLNVVESKLILTVHNCFSMFR
ncbi:MAG: hypothetical protein FWF72_05135 [Paludibacter sp.]|nr:hypothetical protein [Paludibacter sp.]